MILVLVCVYCLGAWDCLVVKIGCLLGALTCGRLL